MLNKLTNRMYKIVALSGYLIIAASIILPLKNIQSLEINTTQDFEKIITSNLEAEGLKNELQHIEKVLKFAEASVNHKTVLKVDDVVYTQYEVERFKKERENINLFLREKELNKDVYISVKDQFLNKIRVLFLSSMLTLVVGTLMAVLGTIAWYFQIELFEDRRKAPR